MTEKEMAEKNKVLSNSEDADIEKEIEKNEKETSLTEDSELQQEKKRYINFYCFQISIGIIFAYLYIIISILMNVINRIIFHTYNFKFNFTILFFQQLFAMITFVLLSMYSKTYRDKVGEISFNIFTSIILNKYVKYIYHQKDL